MQVLLVARKVGLTLFIGHASWHPGRKRWQNGKTSVSEQAVMDWPQDVIEVAVDAIRFIECRSGASGKA
ncbi:hypothetical protein D3C81_2032870 [compost metagenome]